MMQRRATSDESGKAKCTQCGKLLFKPNHCKRCGGIYCHDHTSPSRHSCPNAPQRPEEPPGRKTRLYALVAGASAVVVGSFLIISLMAGAGPVPDWTGTTAFVDVTAEAGVGSQGSGHGLILGDYDADGHVDIYVVNNGGANILYRNNGNGTFTDVTEVSGAGDRGGSHGAAFVDYDNDGDLDIWVANWIENRDPNVLYRNNGNGTFTNVNQASGISKFRPGGSHGCTVLDFDRDGLIDLFATSAEEACILLRNKGDGTFEDYSEKSGMRVGVRPHFQSTIDLDKDGYTDIMVANSDPDDGDKDAPNQFYRNTGLGTFTEVAASVGLVKGDLHGASFGDFNGDGHLDLFAPDAARGSKLNFLLNDGHGRFRDATKRSRSWHVPQRTHAMACGDFDNDGDLDAFLPTGAEDLLFANSGDATFREVAKAAGLADMPGDPKAVGFLDYDDDGDLDVYVVFSDRPNMLFRNDNTEGNWIKVKLVGTRSNRDAVGARIELTCNGKSQVREVCGGRGHMQDPFEQFFGLGKSNLVELISVTWPSGQVTLLENVQPNQELVITEPG